MPDADNRYSLQRERLCNIIIGRLGMRLYIEQRDKPAGLTFKIYQAEGAARIAISVEEMERMSDNEIAANIRAKLGFPE